MREIEGSLCRLCLGVVSNENIGEIGENIKEMLKVLQFKLNFHISDEDIVCSDCMRSIQECLDFIYTYRNVEDLIVALYSKSKSKLDLREVYIQKNKHIITTDIATDQEICRLCMKLNDISSCYPLITIENMIQKCVPELNFNLTKEPVICDSCLDSLKIYFQFLQICVDTEEKITKYFKFEATGSEGPINLNKVVQFTKNISDNESDITKVNVVYNENKIIKTETTVKEENAEFDTENFENDIKTSVEEYIKIELKERSGVLHNGESEMICEPNLIKSEVAFEKESAKFESENVENCVIYKTDVDENVMNMEIKGESLEIQNKKLEVIEEENELQTEHIDFESFRDAATISQMIMNNVNTSVYKCGSCSHIAKNKRQHLQHMLTHQENSEVLIHPECSEVAVYKCESCSYITEEKSNLEKHILIHQSSNLMEYKCSSCLYIAKRKDNLEAHMLSHRARRSGCFRSKIRFNHYYSSIMKHKCHSCPYVTKYKGDLKKHVLITHQYSNIIKYKCESCSYVTKRKGNLKVHMLTHQGLSEVAGYSCDSCLYVAKTKSNLKRHTLTTHQSSDTIWYKCETCPYVATQKSTLKTHMMTHQELSEAIVYTCDECSFKTRYKSSLNKHIRSIHQETLEKTLYRCNNCSFVSNYKESLKNHILINHQSSNIIVYKCGSCSYMAKRKDYLQKHTLTHLK